MKDNHRSSKKGKMKLACWWSCGITVVWYCYVVTVTAKSVGCVKLRESGKHACVSSCFLRSDGRLKSPVWLKKKTKSAFGNICRKSRMSSSSSTECLRHTLEGGGGGELRRRRRRRRGSPHVSGVPSTTSRRRREHFSAFCASLENSLFSALNGEIRRRIVLSFNKCNCCSFVFFTHLPFNRHSLQQQSSLSSKQHRWRRRQREEFDAPLWRRRRRTAINREEITQLLLSSFPQTPFDAQAVVGSRNGARRLVCFATASFSEGKSVSVGKSADGREEEEDRIGHSTKTEANKTTNPTEELTAKRVLVPLADGCEEIEAVSLTDVLYRAGADVCTAYVAPPKNRMGPYIIECSKKTKLIADYHIDHIECDFDAILLPGGIPGAIHLRDNMKLEKLLKRHKRMGRLYGAICASPSVVLLYHGLLADRGQKATGFPSPNLPAMPPSLVLLPSQQHAGDAENEVHETNNSFATAAKSKRSRSTALGARERGPEEKRQKQSSSSSTSSSTHNLFPRVVVSNKCISSVGPGSALEFALTVVHFLYGRSKAQMLQKQLLVNPFIVHLCDASGNVTEQTISAA